MIRILMLTAVTLFLTTTGCTVGTNDIPAAANPTPMPSSSIMEEIESTVSVAATDHRALAIGDDDPMTRALAAKMLAAAFNDLNTINAMDRVIEFADTSPGVWYDKYINAAFSGGLMAGAGHSELSGSALFQPDGYITLAQSQILLDRLDPQKRVRLKITDDTKDTPISYALWLELFNKLLGNLGGASDKFSLGERRLVVLATTANNTTLNQWSVITDRGPFACVGLNLDAYIDKEIRVLIKDGDIVAVLEVTNLSPRISNAYVTAADDTSITIFSGGAERRYLCDNLPTGAQGKICDIVISGGKAREVTLITEWLRDEILLTTQDKIEFLKWSFIEIADGFKVYDITDGMEHVRWKSLPNLIVGTEIADFFMRDGKICAAVITEKADPKMLRVAIQNSGYNGLYHDDVTVSATTAFSVRAEGPSGHESNHAAWEEVKITGEMFGQGSRIQISAEGDGKIVLVGLGRAWPNGEHPKYRGAVEIRTDPKGYIVINTLSMEKYLYAVVPSEMPSSYGVEASMIQAIAARSYSYNQFYANRCHAFGANVDDSVSYQVYNNIPENEVSIRAVNDTHGQVLAYGGEVIIANFFSSSSGYTANGGEVWAHSITRQFPATTAGYLQSTKQFEGTDYHMSDEKEAAQFFKTDDIPAYDSDVGWFRWNVTMTAEEIAAAINAGIGGRYDAKAPLIKTLQDDGVYRSVPVTTIGELKDLTVMRRGAGGNIMEMKVEGTEATVLLITEYNVRALIKPTQLTGGAPIILQRKDGTEIANYSIMPSAFYTMDPIYTDDRRLASVKFTGGGNGHGAGMSQNGARGMLQRGHSISEILSHFYKGTEIIEVY